MIDEDQDRKIEQKIRRRYAKFKQRLDEILIHAERIGKQQLIEPLQRASIALERMIKKEARQAGYGAKKHRFFVSHGYIHFTDEEKREILELLDEPIRKTNSMTREEILRGIQGKLEKKEEKKCTK